MPGKLQDIFGRTFVVGFFLPGAVFTFFTVLLLHCYGILTVQILWDLSNQNPLMSALLMPLSLWLLAISLQVANGWIIRRKEGYGLPRWMTWWQRVKLGLLIKELKALEKAGKDPRPIRHKIAIHFAYHQGLLDYKKLLLPWAFGNTVRAFEAYPLVMYGFEATRGWGRLLAVVPKDYRELVGGAKAEVDFLVNLWFLSWLFLLEYVAFAWITGGFESFWFPVLTYLNVRLSSYWLQGAAVRWGEMVKAAFDVFLPDLGRQLGLPAPATREEAWKTWNQLSEAFLHRWPENLPAPNPEAVWHPSDSASEEEMGQETSSAEEPDFHDPVAEVELSGTR